jgi:flagellar biogenesis protein FliO
MTRFLSLIAAIVIILALWWLTLSLIISSDIDPEIWNQYQMSDLRGH